MNIRRLVIPLAYSLIAAFVAVGAGPSRALAQQDHTHMATLQGHDQTSEQNQSGALIKAVREATERFQDVSAAEAPGYTCNSAASAAPIRGQWACTS